MKIRISVSKYNEVNKEEIGKLFKFGGKLIQSKYMAGRKVGKYTVDGKPLYVFSDDAILINNITLPLSFAPLSYYTEYIEINVREEESHEVKGMAYGYSE